MYRLIYSIPIWIFFLVLTTILNIIGWIVVPIAALCKAYVKTDDNLSKPNDGPIYHFTWKFMKLWDNWEDGIANRNYYKAPNMFLQIVYWSCLRNPTNNLRAVPVLSLKINPEKVRFTGSITVYEDKLGNCMEGSPYDNAFKADTYLYDTKIPQWFYCWCGLYSNFYWQFNLFGKLRRFWIGHKIMPRDIYGIPEASHRYKLAGFAIQFKAVT